MKKSKLIGSRKPYKTPAERGLPENKLIYNSTCYILIKIVHTLDKDSIRLIIDNISADKTPGLGLSTEYKQTDTLLC